MIFNSVTIEIKYKIVSEKWHHFLESVFSLRKNEHCFQSEQTLLLAERALFLEKTLVLGKVMAVMVFVSLTGHCFFDGALFLAEKAMFFAEKVLFGAEKALA